MEIGSWQSSSNRQLKVPNLLSNSPSVRYFKFCLSGCETNDTVSAIRRKSHPAPHAEMASSLG